MGCSASTAGPAAVDAAPHKPAAAAAVPAKAAKLTVVEPSATAQQAQRSADRPRQLSSLQLRERDQQWAMELARELAVPSRAKFLFDELDKDDTGSVDKRELFAKLKADAEIETLLGMKDVSGRSMMGAIKLGKVMKQLDADGGGSIAWLAFEGAVAMAHPTIVTSAHDANPLEEAPSPAGDD